MKVISLAPTRIGLIGGGTDVDPFAHEHGGVVLSLAINLYHKVVLKPLKGEKIKVSCLGEKREFLLKQKLEYTEDKKFNLVKAVINHFRPVINQGFDLKISFEGIGSSGLGSSGSAAVAMISTFQNWLDIYSSRMKIVLLAFKLENEELGWITGKQDQLAAAFGGINLFYFGPKQKVAVESVNLKKSSIEELEKWMLLCFTGSTRHSAKIQKSLKKKMRYYKRERELFALKDSVYEAVSLIKDNKFSRLGRLLDEVWENKKRSNPRASNEKIDHLYSLALKNGALGGKIMGAGGEGHMFFLCPPEKRKGLLKALREKGKMKIVDFDFDFKGLETRRII